jgi:hypothetical protein
MIIELSRMQSRSNARAHEGFVSDPTYRISSRLFFFSSHGSVPADASFGAGEKGSWSGAEAKIPERRKLGYEQQREQQSTGLRGFDHIHPIHTQLFKLESSYTFPLPPFFPLLLFFSSLLLPPSHLTPTSG